VEDGASLRTEASFMFGASPVVAKAPRFQIVAPVQTDRSGLIAKRFDDLAQLKDGWCKDIGVAPDKAGLKAVAEILVNSYPKNLRLPTVVPTLEGNLLLEWGGNDRWVNLDLGSLEAEFCVIDDDGHGHSNRFDLGANDGVGCFMGFLQGRVPQTDGDDTMKLDAPSPHYVTMERLADLMMGRSKTTPIEDVMQEYGLAY